MDQIRAVTFLLGVATQTRAAEPVNEKEANATPIFDLSSPYAAPLQWDRHCFMPEIVIFPNSCLREL
jgi:hypothetical protein